MQRRVNGFPVLEDIFLSKNSGDHQLLALVCTANTVAKKLRSTSTGSQPPETSQASIAEPETINAWELMADLEEEVEEVEKKKPVEGEEEGEEKRPTNDDDFSLRSKSFHAIGDVKMGDAGPDQLMRCRSFHTVEDYEALVTGQKPVSQKLGEANVKDGMCNETKRKTRARELNIQSTTIDLKARRSLRGWEELGDQEEEYVTPKFGSSRAGAQCVGHGDGKEGAVFDPELLAAVEEAMEEMRAEEEIVLRQILEDL